MAITITDIFFNPFTMSPRMEVEFSGNLMIYIGHNMNKNATTSENNWVIIKRIYENNRFVRHQVLTGTWDGRASLAWTIS